MSFKKGDWYCPQCAHHCYAHSNCCFKCHCPKPNNLPKNMMKKGNWICSKCQNHCFADEQNCFRCQNQKPDQGDWTCPCGELNFAYG